MRYSSPAMYIIARMMPARETLTPGFRDVLGVDKAISERIKKGEYNVLFISAVEQGLVGVVKYLLDLGVDAMKIKNETDETMLHFAAWEGHTEIVKLLLDAGADVDVDAVYEDNWCTPLDYAESEGHSEIVSLIKTHKPS